MSFPQLLVFGTTLAVLSMEAPASAQDAEAQFWLKAAASRYQCLKTLKTRLQVSTFFADTEIHQIGSLTIGEGGRVALELRDADSKQWAALFRCDGSHQYQLDWKSKSIVKRVMKKTGGGAPNFFPDFERYDPATARLEERIPFKGLPDTEIGAEKVRVSVALKGKDEKSAFRYVRLLIPANGPLVEQIEFMSPGRRTLMRIRFFDMEVDGAIDASAFVWKHPEDLSGLRIVEVEKQGDGK